VYVCLLLWHGSDNEQQQQQEPRGRGMGDKDGQQRQLQLQQQEPLAGVPTSTTHAHRRESVATVLSICACLHCCTHFSFAPICAGCCTHSVHSSAGAVAAANSAAARALRELTIELQPSSAMLAGAVHLGVLLSTLLAHARSAKVAGWSVPLVGTAEQHMGGEVTGGAAATPAAAAAQGSGAVDWRGKFMLHKLWPYWMQRNDDTTVTNDVTLNGFVLLTGPNMAGAMSSLCPPVICAADTVASVKDLVWHMLHIVCRGVQAEACRPDTSPPPDMYCCTTTCTAALCCTALTCGEALMGHMHHAAPPP
jgi:hypothetical protein